MVRVGGDSGAPSYREPLHLLMVEDDPKDAERLQGALQAFADRDGAEIEIDSAATYEGAKDKLVTNYYDLIVLDLVLHPGEPREPEEWEGLWLLQDLQELRLQEQSSVIVLTHFSSEGEAVHRAFSDFSVASFWGKGGQEALVESFITFLDEHHHFGLKIEVEFEDGEGWSELISALSEIPFRRMDTPLSRPDAELELNHLVRRLVDDCARIEVAQMSSGNSGASILRIGRRKPSGVHVADVLVKYGAVDQIRAEVANWEETRELIRNFRLTQIERSVTGRYLGAIEYTLIGADAGRVIPFAEFYASRDVLDIEKCLEGLFRQTCSLWYEEENRFRRNGVNLADHYERLLGFDIGSIGRAYQFKFGLDALHKPELDLAELPRRLPNPIKGLVQGWRPEVVDTFICRTHGDMHGENLLVDVPGGNAWMIDFASTGVAHWARDLCMLEASIKFQYLEPESLEKIFAFEDCLLSGPTLDIDLASMWSGDLQFEKAARAIQVLRKFGAEASAELDPEQAFDEYCTALLFTTLNRFRFHKLLKRKIRKRHLLLSSALLYERFNR